MAASRDRLVLASSSPRRRELLLQLGLSLVVDPPALDESVRPGEVPPAFALRVAREKAAQVAPRHPGDVVLAADTVVALDGDPFGKPADAAHAAAMLKRLSGKQHEVHTGVAAVGPAASAERVVSTRVRFRDLSDAEIAWYVASGEPMDKAGAYGIQGRGGVFVISIEGSASNVVGLPLAEALELVARVGLRLPWEVGA